MKNDRTTMRMIKKARLFQVTPKWSQSLRVRVMQNMNDHALQDQVISDANTAWYSIFFSRKAYAGAFAIVAIVFFSNENLSSKRHFALAQWNIFQGDNAYEKSIASLEYTDLQTKRLTENASSVQIAYLEKSILTSQKELDALQLMGEHGKYTQEDCLGVYRLYDAKLDNIQTALEEKLHESKDSASRNQILHALDTTQNALEEANNRINLYPTPHQENKAFTNEK